MITETNLNTNEVNTDIRTDVKNFDELIFRIRNNTVHDGDYWSSQIFVTNKVDKCVSGYDYESA